MIPLYDIKKYFYFIICAAFIFGCSQDAEKKINKGLELYNNGEIAKAASCIEEGLVIASSIKKVNENRLSYGHNVLFSRQKKILKIIWPLEMELELADNYNIVSYDQDAGKLGLSNGTDIRIYNSEGSLVKTCGPTPDDKQIKAFIISSENIYYYKNKGIFIYDQATDTERLLMPDKSNSFSDKESYEVYMYRAGNLLGTAVGIAGKYNYNIFDLNSNSAVIQNLSLSSNKLLLRYNELYYITGNAGKYVLARLSVPSMKIKNLFQFENLLDVEFFSSGLLFENRNGFWGLDYEKSYARKIPFSYELKGECCGKAVIKYSGNYYIVDSVKFFEMIDSLKDKAPSIFEIMN
ncbi:MAG: hypothetical protein V1874_00680 [Spirochaetota bacterium]